MLDEFDFELAYMSVRNKDIDDWFDEIMAEPKQSISLVSYPSESESDEESWVSTTSI